MMDPRFLRIPQGMRVRVDAGRLARAIGDQTQSPPGPGLLSTLIIPTLDIAPYLFTPVDETGQASEAGFSPVGSGSFRILSIPNPAAGADYAITVPAGVAWHLRSFQATFTASAVAATRRPRIRLSDVADVSIMLIADVLGIVNGQAFNVVWAQGINSRVSSGGLLEGHMDVPADFIGGPGFQFKTVTLNIQAGDQWSAGRLFVREYAA